MSEVVEPATRDAPPLRVGIIGAGNIARNHVKGYKAAGAQVVAIADTNPVTLETRAAEWSVPHAFADFRDLLQVPGLDAVSVCTPNSAHHAPTIAAAAAGKHVLCEKPISLSLTEADEMIGACHDAGVVLQIDHHLRSNRSVGRARRMIESGALGRVTFVRLRQAHDWSGRAEVPPGFRLRALAGGGTLLDNGCHLFDLARYLGGPVAEVFCRTATLKFDIEVEDTASVSLLFQSGALGQIETSWTATGWDQGFWIDGTFTWMVGPKTLRSHVTPVITAAAQAAGRPSPRIIVGLPICITSDCDAARARAERGFGRYGQLPSYRAMLDREGAASPGDVALIGSESEVEDQLAEFERAGGTELSASVFGSAEEHLRTFEFLKAQVAHVRSTPV